MTLELGNRLTGRDDAPLVVFVGSLGTTQAMWDGQVADLVPAWRCLTIDLPGHGSSPVPADAPAVEAIADSVLSLLDTVNVDSFALVGLSLGAAVAASVAALAPARVTALTLASTSLRFDVRRAFWLERAASVRAQGLGDVVASSARTWFTPNFAWRDADERDRLITMLATTPPEGYAVCCETLAEFDGRQMAKRISAPTLVIAGELDEATPVADASGVAASVQSADLVVIEDAAHLVNVEGRREFSHLLIDHLGAHMPWR